MKYIFFGSPDFAAIILNKLIEAGFVPAAVVCNPDRPVGRKKILTPPAVKRVVSSKWYAASNNADEKDRIKIFQTETKDNLIEIKPLLLATNPELLIVAAYAKIIPKEILEIPRLGTIGVHPSLLPKYRGATPIQTAILNGDAEAGVTLYLMDEKIDHGSILANGKWKMENGITYEKLHNELAKLAGELLIEILPKFINGEIKPKEQNHAEATFTKKFTAEDAFIEPEDLRRVQGDSSGFALGMTKRGHSERSEESLAIEIDRKIRALNPEPGTWTTDNGKRIKLLEAEIIDGKLRLKKTQKEGGKPQTVW